VQRRLNFENGRAVAVDCRRYAHPDEVIHVDDAGDANARIENFESQLIVLIEPLRAESQLAEMLDDALFHQVHQVFEPEPRADVAPFETRAERDLGPRSWCRCDSRSHHLNLPFRSSDHFCR
jgi:hypothetical protein